MKGKEKDGEGISISLNGDDNIISMRLRAAVHLRPGAPIPTYGSLDELRDQASDIMGDVAYLSVKTLNQDLFAVLRKWLRHIPLTRDDCILALAFVSEWRKIHPEDARDMDRIADEITKSRQVNRERNLEKMRHGEAIDVTDAIDALHHVKDVSENVERKQSLGYRVRRWLQSCLDRLGGEDNR